MSLEITLEGQLRRILEDEEILDSNKKDMLRYSDISTTGRYLTQDEDIVFEKFRRMKDN